MMVLIFVVMYFFMIRPQQKKQKELVKFRDNLKKGDKVLTAGGIYGVVVEVKDQYVLVEVDANVKIRFDKSAIVNPGLYEGLTLPIAFVFSLFRKSSTL